MFMGAARAFTLAGTTGCPMHQELVSASLAPVSGTLVAQGPMPGSDFRTLVVSHAEHEQRSPDEPLDDWAVLALLGGTAVGCLAAFIGGACGISLLVG